MLLAKVSILLIGFVVRARSCAAAAGRITHVALIRNHGEFQIVSDIDHPGALATASYLDSVHTASGWGQLSISTKAGIPDAHQLYAAGAKWDACSCCLSVVSRKLDPDRDRHSMQVIWKGT